MIRGSQSNRQLSLSVAMLTVCLAFGCNNDRQTNETLLSDNTSSGNLYSTTLDAACQLESIGDSGVTGLVEFVQQGDQVHVHGKITGLSPGKHGFHVHESGDLSDKETGKSAGGHFNPKDQPHGRPSDEKRHVGDLGNIVANDDGTAEIDITDTIIRLDGEHSIIGRALMVHAKEDQFTQPTGEAGDRVAFGVIEAVNKK